MQIALNLAGLISILLSVVLPATVGLVTKMSTHATLKAFLLPLLAAVTAVLSQYVNDVSAGHEFSWSTTALAALIGYGVAVAVHFGIMIPTGLKAAAQNALVADPAPVVDGQHEAA